jgi:hypothetical protein
MPKLAPALLAVVLLVGYAESVSGESAPATASSTTILTSLATTAPPQTTAETRTVVVVTSRHPDAATGGGTVSWGVVLGGLALVFNLVNITVWRDVVRKGWPRGWVYGRFYIAASFVVLWALWSLVAVIRWAVTGDMQY